MQFFDLLSDGDTKPTVQATKNSVIISLPQALARQAGIEKDTPVRLQYGEDGDRRAVRLSASTSATDWSVKGRAKVLQIFARQLMPKQPVDKTVVKYATDAATKAITLDLPDGWELEAPEVVSRDQPSRARR